AHRAPDRARRDRDARVGAGGRGDLLGAGPGAAAAGAGAVEPRRPDAARPPAGPGDVRAFALGYVAPITGTVIEAVLQVPVPHLNALWKLNLLFPLVMAYAMVRYDLFDVRAAVRAGAAYTAATGLVVLAYAGAITVTDLVLTSLDVSTSPIVAAAVTAVLVLVLLNPLYLQTQRVVDRLFFR